MRRGAEDIPLPADSVDTVLVTYTLCSIPDVAVALKDMRRVLRHDGQLLFCEHGAAPDVGVRKWQDRLNPLWAAGCGGCNLNRDIPGLLEGSRVSHPRPGNHVHTRLQARQLQLLGRCGLASGRFRMLEEINLLPSVVAA